MTTHGLHSIETPSFDRELMGRIVREAEIEVGMYERSWEDLSLNTRETYCRIGKIIFERIIREINQCLSG